MLLEDVIDGVSVVVLLAVSVGVDELVNELLELAELLKLGALELDAELLAVTLCKGVIEIDKLLLVELLPLKLGRNDWENEIVGVKL